MIAALLLVLAAQAVPPASWTCEPVRFADGVCDCGCNAVDDDCSGDIACARDGCPDGSVVDDNGITCTDDGADEPAEAGGCGSGMAAAFLAFPLVLRRRRR